MRNKNTFWIACSLTMLCCAAWMMTASTTNVGAKAKSQVRVQITLDEPGAVGTRLTAAEAMSLLPEQFKAKAAADMAQQGWKDSTRLNVIVKQKTGNGTWEAVGIEALNDDKKEVKCLCCSSNCMVCCECTDGERCNN